ncbi:MAG: hypothetical protein F6K11_04340 [Leptolyngbya sp. SIO3F4]|nr:hypothetical protein [Leptolyngbya sp. SIO3F4]
MMLELVNVLPLLGVLTIACIGLYILNWVIVTPMIAPADIEGVFASFLNYLQRETCHFPYQNTTILDVDELPSFLDQSRSPRC